MTLPGEITRHRDAGPLQHRPSACLFRFSYDLDLYAKNHPRQAENINSTSGYVSVSSTTSAQYGLGPAPRSTWFLNAKWCVKIALPIDTKENRSNRRFDTASRFSICPKTYNNTPGVRWRSAPQQGAGGEKRFRIPPMRLQKIRSCLG